MVKGAIAALLATAALGVLVSCGGGADSSSGVSGYVLALEVGEDGNATQVEVIDVAKRQARSLALPPILHDAHLVPRSAGPGTAMFGSDAGVVLVDAKEAKLHPLAIPTDTLRLAYGEQLVQGGRRFSVLGGITDPTLVELSTGKSTSLARFRAPGGAFSPDDRYLALSGPNQSFTGGETWIIPTDAPKDAWKVADAGAVDWSPDGKKLVLAGRPGRILDVDDKKSTPLAGERVTSGAYLDDGRLVVAGGGRGALLSSDGKVLKRFAIPESSMIEAAQGDGALVYTEYLRWSWLDLRTGKIVELPKLSGSSFAAQPTGRVAFLTSARGIGPTAVKVYAVDIGSGTVRDVLELSNRQQYMTAQVASDGRHALIADQVDRSVRELWLVSARGSRQLAGDRQVIGRFSPDGRYVLVARGASLDPSLSLKVAPVAGGEALDLGTYPVVSLVWVSR